MKPFLVTVCIGAQRFTYTAIAPTSIDAWDAEADRHGDTPCGITVTPQA